MSPKTWIPKHEPDCPSPAGPCTCPAFPVRASASAGSPENEIACPMCGIGLGAHLMSCPKSNIPRSHTSASSAPPEQELDLELPATLIKDSDLHALYYELIFAVGQKHEGETRHQTALRYIRQAEQSSSGPASEVRAALASRPTKEPDK